MGSTKKTFILPQYLRLKEQLLDRIISNEWNSDDCLPSERALCEEQGLSRMTVRRALAELEKDGVIKRIQGKGSVLNKEKITQPLLKLTSFSEDMRVRGLTPGAQILVLDKIPSNIVLSRKLEIELGEEVILLKRLRLADGEPLAIETAYLNASVCNDIYDKLAQNSSLYQLMRTCLKVNLCGAKQSIELSRVQGWEAKLLRIADDAVVMKIERLTLDERKKPIEYVVSKYRADKYKFYIELFE